MTIEHLPTLSGHPMPPIWADVLRKVQSVFPTAIIAGGALRDLDHDRPIKDVDIFVPGPALREILTLFPDAVTTIPGDDKASRLARGAFEPVFYANHVTTIDGWRFEISVTDKPLHLWFDYCDIGLCKIIYNGVSVEKHEDYIRDSAGGNVTVYGDIEFCRKHVERIMTKYPNFTLRSVFGNELVI